MKTLAVLIVSIAIVFFIVGGVLAWYGIFPVASYALAAGIIGSIASTVGLLAFASPRLTSSDIQNIEGELIEKLAIAAKSVDEYESKISKNKEQIERLERDRREIELLVRQASVKVFLEEKLRGLSDEIEQRVLADARLSEHLIEYTKTKDRVAELNGQISSSPRAELIQEIIGEIQPGNRRIYVEWLGLRLDIAPVFRATELLAANILKGFAR